MVLQGLRFWEGGGEYSREEKAECRYTSPHFLSILSIAPELFQLPTLASGLILFFYALHIEDQLGNVVHGVQLHSSCPSNPAWGCQLSSTSE